MFALFRHFLFRINSHPLTTLENKAKSTSSTIKNPRQTLSEQRLSSDAPDPFVIFRETNTSSEVISESSNSQLKRTHPETLGTHLRSSRIPIKKNRHRSPSPMSQEPSTTMGATKPTASGAPTSSVRRSPLSNGEKKKIGTNFLHSLQRDFKSLLPVLPCHKCGRQGNWRMHVGQDKTTKPAAPTFSCITCTYKPVYTEVRKLLTQLKDQEKVASPTPAANDPPQPHQCPEATAQEQPNTPAEPLVQHQQQQPQSLVEQFAHVADLPDVIKTVLRQLDHQRAILQEHAAFQQKFLDMQQRNELLQEEIQRLREELAAARATQHQPPVLDEDMDSCPPCCWPDHWPLGCRLARPPIRQIETCPFESVQQSHC
ncbi:hypothetical protein BCR43DRAFT_513301 [Syncephalastrum racemosum]|uniref:Uncharacterized protein n=1 Tax=Syncephalastrum racemosum TaxID=13706 RepID=A0A1X2HJ79_SYNRA|nr:hypothetical protein BCR43DRAFT_513301 [Syncephalastrum racemosum]